MGDGLFICLDVGHVYLTDCPMVAFLDSLHKRIVHLHLQDISSVDESDLPGVFTDHYLPGTGGIPAEDWRLLVNRLRAVSFDGTAIFKSGLAIPTRRRI